MHVSLRPDSASVCTGGTLARPPIRVSAAAQQWMPAHLQHRQRDLLSFISRMKKGASNLTLWRRVWSLRVLDNAEGIIASEAPSNDGFLICGNFIFKKSTSGNYRRHRQQTVNCVSHCSARVIFCSISRPSGRCTFVLIFSSHRRHCEDCARCVL